MLCLQGRIGFHILVLSPSIVVVLHELGALYGSLLDWRHPERLFATEDWFLASPTLQLVLSEGGWQKDIVELNLLWVFL